MAGSDEFSVGKVQFGPEFPGPLSEKRDLPDIGKPVLLSSPANPLVGLWFLYPIKGVVKEYTAEIVKCIESGFYLVEIKEAGKAYPKWKEVFSIKRLLGLNLYDDLKGVLKSMTEK